jgi:hypothetical protein
MASLFNSLNTVSQNVAGTVPTSGWVNIGITKPPSVNAKTTIENLDVIGDYGVREKGRETGREEDLGTVSLKGTMADIETFAHEFLDCIPTNSDLTFSAAPATGTGYTVSALTSTQANKLRWATAGAKTLVYAQGYTTAANNGVKLLTAKPATSDVLVPVAGNTTEASPTRGVLEICGIRAVTSDLSLTISGSTGILVSQSNSVAALNSVDFTTLGLTVGQEIHIGGVTSSTQFGSGSKRGFATITSITATILGLKNIRPGIGALTSDTGIGQAVDILFGRFIRNVPVTNTTEYKQYMRAFEVKAEMASEGNSDMFAYFTEQRAGKMEIKLAANKLNEISVTYQGAGFTPFTTSRLTGPSSAVLPTKDQVSSGAVDVFGARFQDSSGTFTEAYFKSLEVMVDRQLEKQERLGVSGADDFGRKTLKIELSAEIGHFNGNIGTLAYGANPQGSLSFVTRIGDGAVCIGTPLATLSIDGYEPEVGKVPGYKCKLEPVRDADSNHQVLQISTFPIVPVNVR